MSSSGVYDVFVKISLLNEVSPGLGMIARDLVKLDTQFKDINLAIKGMGAAFAGVKLGHFVGNMVDANAELQRQANLFRAAGNSAADMGRAVSAAYATAAAVPAVNATEALKLYRELAGATQDNAGAISVLTPTAKAMRVMEAAIGHANSADMTRLFKFVELRQMAIDEVAHKIDPTKFNSEIQWATKALIASQGLITTNDLLQFQKQAGPMGKNITPEQLFDDYLAVMEDMGGARTGTSLTALGRQVFGGIMSPKAANHWRDLGLLDPNHLGWHEDKHGNVFIDEAKKAITGYGILGKEGALAFVDKVLRPAMAAHGMTNISDQNKGLYELVSTETARRLVSVLLAPEQVHLVQERLKQAMGGQEAYDRLFDGGDWKESSKAFHESITTLKTALGDAADASPLLMKLAKGIGSLADVVKDHPNIAAITTIGGAIGSGGLVVGGTAALGVAGYRLITAAGALQAAAVSLGAKGAIGAAGAVTAAEVAAGGWSLGRIVGGVSRAAGWLGAGWLTTDAIVTIGTKLGYGKRENEIDATEAALRASGKGWSPALQEKMADYLSPGGEAYLKTIGDHGFHNARPGSSYVPPPAPNVHVETKVVLDGRQIAAAVESRIVTNNRTVNSAAGFDGRAAWAHPEVAFR